MVVSAVSLEIQHRTTGPRYPILEVPEEDILAQGTTDPLDDTATQARLSDQASCTESVCREQVAKARPQGMGQSM